MTLGGLDMSSFLMDNMVDVHRLQKTRTKHFVLAHRNSVDGTLEIISPEELMWYCIYVNNFYINKDAKLQKAFNIVFAYHANNILS
jgi:hypothetical protein